jgi:imidazoleglycerol-phosphate dehydratase
MTTPTSPLPAPAHRTSSARRSTKETSIEVDLDIDGTGVTDVSTGLPFFDHMVSQLGRHGGFDLRVLAKGDLEVDAHHTGSVSLPLDEALVDVALDLSGRPFLVYDLDFPPEVNSLGNPPFDPQLAEEFWRAFATAAAMTLHVRLRSGKNTHHIVEASFKGVARALRDAVRVEGSGIPSTKGVL